jgi:putative transcriptional regulator
MNFPPNGCRLGYMINDFGKNNAGSLAGHLLIATPVVKGSCFERSVIYLCAHNKDGAMGIIVNYPVETVAFREIFDQLGIGSAPGARGLPIHFGGPVESSRGFVLHGGGYQPQHSIISRDGIYVTASVSILQDLAEGQGPEKGMLALGYAGWAAGQLESEIETGSWIVAAASPELMFDADNETKWSLAISSMGIDLGHLSTHVGHA